MKMKNNSFKDAIELAEAIYEELYPHQASSFWTVVNIAKHNDRTFSVAEDEEIPLSYGYSFDETVEILRDYGVFEIGEQGRWFIRFIDKSDRYDKPKTGIVTDEDKISREGNNLGYVVNSFSYYHDDIKDKNSKPQTEGLYTVLVNVKLLNKFIRSAEKLLNSRDYWYENQQLKFMLIDGEIDQFDFSKAELSEKLFRTFFTLWKSDGKGEYTVASIVSKYKELFGEELGASRIGEIVSNIRHSIINPKPLLNNRIDWEFDRKNKSWIFRITPRTS